MAHQECFVVVPTVHGVLISLTVEVHGEVSAQDLAGRLQRPFLLRITVIRVLASA